MVTHCFDSGRDAALTMAGSMVRHYEHEERGREDSRLVRAKYAHTHTHIQKSFTRLHVSPLPAIKRTVPTPLKHVYTPLHVQGLGTGLEPAQQSTRAVAALERRGPARGGARMHAQRHVHQHLRKIRDTRHTHMYVCTLSLSDRTITILLSTGG